MCQTVFKCLDDEGKPRRERRRKPSSSSQEKFLFLSIFVDSLDGEMLRNHQGVMAELAAHQKVMKVIWKGLRVCRRHDSIRNREFLSGSNGNDNNDTICSSL